MENDKNNLTERERGVSSSFETRAEAGRVEGKKVEQGNREFRKKKKKMKWIE